PHSALPWVETGCSRCHYDVAEAATRVESTRCATCHGDDDALVARGAGTNLHPTHTAVTCTACHQGDTHRVRAMSSAVQLACADCHVRAHDVTLPGEWRDDRTCNSCHETVHQSQQRLLLGMLPGEQASPSSKFIAGMTCRSCHIRTERTVASGAAIRGQAEACASCHTTEYRQVLDWWVDGTRSRSASVSAWVSRAQSELGPVADDSATALLASSAAMVSLVAEAGGHHNLELSDRIFREAVARVLQAYTMSRRPPPQAPVLGSPAHEGVCSYCHYSPDDPWDFRRMSDRFHRSVMSGGQ
ncbi:MAG TPA: cytochrome c3 family protein, partial [Longimicrobiales bacterium]|nr:cytochrome c3 family protein [Longimicrobiales bacterium]